MSATFGISLLKRCTSSGLQEFLTKSLKSLLARMGRVMWVWMAVRYAIRNMPFANRNRRLAARRATAASKNAREDFSLSRSVNKTKSARATPSAKTKYMRSKPKSRPCTAARETISLAEWIHKSLACWVICTGSDVFCPGVKNL